MNVSIFNAKSYDRKFLDEASKTYKHELKFFDVHVSLETYKLGLGFDGTGHSRRYFFPFTDISRCYHHKPSGIFY